MVIGNIYLKHIKIYFNQGLFFYKEVKYIKSDEYSFISVKSYNINQFSYS